MKLPKLIQTYIDACNRHDVNSILACFSDNAVVRDEGETLRGKEEIEAWVVKTIEKYKFQLKPLGVKNETTEVVVSMKVSGTFDGSPITLDYHFRIEKGKILSLAVK